MLIQRAAQPHSVRRSLTPLHAAMFVIGASGMPEPNVARFEASPWVCFADGDAPAGGGDGGGGDGGKPAGDKTFTQAEVNAIIARERRSTEDKLTKQFGESTAKTHADLDALRVQLEESGKSSAEKERLAAERTRNAMEAKNAELAKGVAERDAALTAAQHELRETRLGHELTSLFGAKKVLPEMTRAATLVFRADSKIEYGDGGKVVSVDVGAKQFNTVAEALDDWMTTNGAGYVAAPSGGAGTRAGNAGVGRKSLGEMSLTEMAEAAKETNASTGR